MSVGPSGIEWTNEKRKLNELHEWDRNPRRITDSQAKQLAKSIIKFGYVEPIQINLDNMIIGGHMRHRILLQAGILMPFDDVDVRVPSRMLSEDEAEELAIRLNRNQGTWDFEMLATEFDQGNLADWGFVPADFGMSNALGKAEMKPSKLQPAAGKEIECPSCGTVIVM